MITYKSLYTSARLRSLPLSVSGIIMGSAMAYQNGFFRTDIFVFALLTTICFQLLSDFANDYGDNQKGTDNQARLGPKRAIQLGVMTLSEMKKIIGVMMIISLISAIILIYIAFGRENLVYSISFFFLATMAIVAAIKYTIGKNAYGYKGLGDIFVFIFFGIVSVVGSNFLYTHQFQWKILLPASAIGMLCMAVLNLNNMRDIDNDRAMNKRTIPVILGSELARYYHYILVLLPMLLLMAYSLLTLQLGIKTLYMIAFVPLIFHLVYVKRHTMPQELDSQLKVVAFSTFLLSILFFIGMFF